MTDLIITVPTHCSKQEHLDVLETALRTLSRSVTVAESRKRSVMKRQWSVGVVVVDDYSPTRPMRRSVKRLAQKYADDFIQQPENLGYSSAVNVGNRIAKSQGTDIIHANSDLEFHDEEWLFQMRRTAEIGVALPDGAHQIPGIIGAKLVYPIGLIQHAGIAFSLLTRTFYHLGCGAPPNMREFEVPKVVPVTGALMYIKNMVLHDVGLFDEGFGLGHEDVSYNLMAFKKGHVAVYDPKVEATHHESLFRREPTEQIKAMHMKSNKRFAELHNGDSFMRWMVEL